MRAPEIIARLFVNDLPLTKDRIEKAKTLAKRSKVAWEDVLEAMTIEQRRAVGE